MLLSMKKYKNLCFYLLLILAVYLLFKFLFPVASALSLAFLVAYFMQKPISYLYTRLHIPKWLSSLVFLFAFVLSFILLVWLLVVKLFQELSFYYENTADTITPFLKTFIEFISKNFADVIEKASELFSSVGELFPRALIFFGVFFFSAFYFSRDYNKISLGAERFIFSQNVLCTAKKSIRTIVSGYFKLYFILFLFTFSCLFLSFTILDISLAFTLAFTISIFDALPALGIGIIMIPWGIFEYTFSDKKLGMWLIIIFAIITVVKEILKPKILGGFVGLHPIVSLVSISSGYLLMGFTGAIFLPFAVYVMIELQKNNRNASA